MGLRSSSLYSELRLKPIPHHRPPKRVYPEKRVVVSGGVNTKIGVLEEVVLVFGRAKF
jgi:hypothetical protein